jgi:ribosome-associated toxin RatA of RatAB toxin-antitoxin module
MKEIARSAIVEHTPAQMYALVDDIESYPRFLPWCLDARVEDIGGRRRATLTAGMAAIRQSFTTENENQPQRAIDMRLVEGPFRHFSAAWRFAPLGERACQVDFELRYDFASRTLGRVLEPLFDKIADTMVDAFTRRADELYGHHPG